MQIPELIPGIQEHNELNPLLWQGELLRDDVKQALLKIAKRFVEYLDVPVEVEDIIVTGSQASYNYTAHSDLDLHIIVDYATVQCDQPVEELFDTKRKLWKLSHHITIHGVPVELYAEDTARPVTGSTYSILSNNWKVKAKKQRSPDLSTVGKTTRAWAILINKAIESKDENHLQEVKTMLMHYRQLSLKQEGEMSKGNIVFKSLRNSGLLAKLMNALNTAQDRFLSLPD